MDLSDVKQYALDGSAPHQLYLSRLYMMGAGVERNVDEAMDWLNKAIERGDAAAFAERAVVLAQGYAGQIDHHGAWQDLLTAAERDDVGAVRQIALFTAMIGDRESAYALLERVAGVGDVPSALLLAEFLREEGNDDAQVYYAQAQDNPLAQWRLGNGAGRSDFGDHLLREIPQDILDVLDAFDPFEVDAITAERKCDDPLVFVKQAAVPSVLCQYVMALGAGNIRVSEVVDPDTGQSKQDDYRTGYLHQFVPGSCDFAIAVFDHHLAVHTNTALQHGEPLTMIVYHPGQEYKPHWDFLVDTMDESFGRLGRSGNRERTALVILDDGYEGGETHFPKLDLSVRLRRGDMLMFRNMTEAGTCHELSMHAGLPVQSGMKWLASKWIRERAYAH